VSTGGVAVRGVLHHAAIAAGDRLAGSTTWRRRRTSDPVRVVELLGCARANHHPGDTLIGPRHRHSTFVAALAVVPTDRSAQLVDDGRGVEPDVFAADEPVAELEDVQHAKSDAAAVAW
jgi:hypothetical protein